MNDQVKTIDARTFIELWKAFAQNLPKAEDLERRWSDKVWWTENVIGPPKASGKLSPLGDHIKKEGGLGETWFYRTEEWKVDLVLAQRGLNWKVPVGWEHREDWVEEWKREFLPVTYGILIEHEDTCGTSWEEMLKLIHLRGKLKVLITYTTDVHDERSLKASKDHVWHTREQFMDMLIQASDSYPENEKTEYLLIIGQLDNRSKPAEVKWYYSIYKSTGEASHHPLVEKHDSETR